MKDGMVNGRVSLVIYLGAWASVLFSIVGSVILAMGNHSAPPELHDAQLAAFAIIAGSHVKAPLEALSNLGKSKPGDSAGGGAE